ncbi:MAG: hypothetical protein AAF682_16815 [Planctomycetota bacterium]
MVSSTPEATARPPGWLARWGLWPAYVLFFLMLVVPTVHAQLKGMLLLGSLFFVAIGAPSSRRPTLHGSVARWVLVLTITGLFFMLRGLLRGEPGALNVGTVYVVWPLLFVMLLAGLRDTASLRGFVRLIGAGTLVVAVLGLQLILSEGGLAPALPLGDLLGDVGVGVEDGTVRFRMPGLATLVFTVPFLIAILWTWPPETEPYIRRALVWLCVMTSLFAIALSGRRALLAVVVLSPPMAFGFALFLPGAERRAAWRSAWWVATVLGGVLVVVSALLVHLFDYSLAPIWDLLWSGFRPTETVADSIRSVQMREMKLAWEGDPLLGRGLGSFLRRHVRDPDMPWAYEASYGTLLFQTGVVGTLIYGGLMAWLYARGIAVIRAGGSQGALMVALMTGLSGFLIANASNPYLVKFDLMWTVFLPLAVINRWLLDAEQAAPAEP